MNKLAQHDTERERKMKLLQSSMNQMIQFYISNLPNDLVVHSLAVRNQLMTMYLFAALCSGLIQLHMDSMLHLPI